MKLDDIKAGKYDYGLPFHITGYWTKPGEKYWHHPLYYIMEQWDVNKATQNLLYSIKQETAELKIMAVNPPAEDPPPAGDESLRQGCIRRPTDLVNTSVMRSGFTV